MPAPPESERDALPAAPENPLKVVWTLAWPAVALNSLQTVNALLDSYFINQVSRAAMTAVGATTGFIFLFFAISCAIWTASIALATLRFGLLTLGATLLVDGISRIFIPTFDFSVWDAGNIWFANGVLIALAVYGFFTATRGQRLLKDEVFDT